MLTLTAREREVAGLVSKGLTNKEIARDLAISVETVKEHCHSLLTKCGLRNRTELAVAWVTGQMNEADVLEAVS